MNQRSYNHVPTNVNGLAVKWSCCKKISKKAHYVDCDKGFGLQVCGHQLGKCSLQVVFNTFYITALVNFWVHTLMLPSVHKLIILILSIWSLEGNGMILFTWSLGGKVIIDVEKYTRACSILLKQVLIAISVLIRSVT